MDGIVVYTGMRHKSVFRRPIAHWRAASYSCQAVLPRGEIGCLCEAVDSNTYKSLASARLPLARLTEGERE